MKTGSRNDADLRTAFETVNRIYAFNAKHSRELHHLPESRVLYHYTTAEGLKGIVEKNELWATSAYFLNDSAEVSYGYGVLKEVLDKWASRSPKGTTSPSVELAEYLKNGLEVLLNNNVVAPIFLACFCEDGNLLSQWRSYGASGGYALGFRFSEGNDGRILQPEPKPYTARLIKVEYQRHAQIARCETMLTAVLPILDEPNVAHAIPEVNFHNKVNYEAISGLIWEMLLEEALGFKDSAFVVEKEWRLVVRRREMLKQSTDDGGKTPTPHHFRAARGYLVPYVRLIPTAEGAKIPLCSIRSGPTLDSLAVKLSIHPFLDCNGLREVRLDQSEISARF